MATNRLHANAGDDNALGVYLRDRRERLDPATLGFTSTRRPTPGLRREEVAQRADVSATWYTWLEQGRGGAPSPQVLDRIAHALLLNDDEREYLYLLALGRTPDVRYAPIEEVTPRLQRVLDAFEFSPAYIKTATWDVVAWNRAAVHILSDYSAIEPSQRNLVRLVFSDSHVRAKQPEWERNARFIVAAFRADSTRAAASDKANALVAEMCVSSPEFASMWSENDVRTTYGEGAKSVLHPIAGLISLEYSAFGVDGRPDLDMVVYNPVSGADVARIRDLIGSRE
jgi:transcriptional regulator with XRE-family HTH domain